MSIIQASQWSHVLAVVVLIVEGMIMVVVMIVPVVQRCQMYMFDTSNSFLPQT